MTLSLRLPEFPFTKITLANGLDVIVRRHGRLPIVAVNLWYHVGSKNEERRQRGFAHLFEHLMFEGSSHYPGDFFKPLQRKGAAINGSTSSDRTNYYEDVPTAHLELALAMESDRMGNLIPALTEHKLRVQKDVVKNEYRQNYANRPYGMVSRLLAEAIHPPEHPYSWLTIGVMEDVEAATLDDVGAFFHRHYVPSNASLCLAGDVDEDQALALAERYFGPIAGGAKTLQPRVDPLTLGSDVDLVLHDRVELARVYLAWPSAPLFHEDDAALSLLADVLTRGKSSRLHQKLVVDEQVAQDVSSYHSGRELSGSFGAYATLRPGRSVQEARDRIDAEIANLAREGPTEAELSRVKNGRLAGFFHALENVGGFGGVADRLNAYNVYLGDPGRITSDFQRYNQVTADAVRDAASRYLHGQPRVALTVKAHPAAKPYSPALDRAVVPPSAPASAFQAPIPQPLTLRSGLPLWVIPERSIPSVSATLVLGGGASMHSARQGGLAELSMSLLDEGTTTRSSLAIALEAEGMGASLSTSCGWDGSYVSVDCLAPHLGNMLGLAVDILRNPTFPETEWRRIQAQTLAALRAERASAEARAVRGLLAAIYPADHPYSLPSDGSEASVSALTRDDLARFHQACHGPSRAAWVVSGDVDADEFARRLDDLLEGWTGPATHLAEIAVPKLADHPRILVLDRPEASQAAVRVGHVGMRRLDPDFTDGLVLNQILGGQFSSRLNARLREEKGYTYGVRSHFDVRRAAGPFFISAALQTDAVAYALDDLRHEIFALLGDRPPTQDELDDARRSLIEGQARHLETPSALVSRYASLFVHGLPADYHARLTERLDAVSIDSLLDVATRRIHPRSFVAVVVADASKVVEPLGRLGWAELTVLQAE
jgi:predicted Zn-dependent peptidase